MSHHPLLSRSAPHHSSSRPLLIPPAPPPACASSRLQVLQQKLAAVGAPRRVRAGLLQLLLGGERDLGAGVADGAVLVSTIPTTLTPDAVTTVVTHTRKQNPHLPTLSGAPDELETEGR